MILDFNALYIITVKPLYHGCNTIILMMMRNDKLLLPS